jgi:hypothetical protein
VTKWSNKKVKTDKKIGLFSYPNINAESMKNGISCQKALP